MYRNDYIIVIHLKKFHLLKQNPKKGVIIFNEQNLHVHQLSSLQKN